jgi:hypothetical protein
MAGDDLISGLGTTGAASRSCDVHTCALFTLHTHLTHWIKALGQIVACRGLSTDSPKDQYGSLNCQHFIN